MRRTLLLALVALAGCGASDGGDGSDRFEEEGFEITFEYPDEMNEASNVQISSGAGSSAKATAGVGYGKEESNDVIIVQRYDLKRAIDEDDLDQAKAELDPLVKQISPGAGSGETGDTNGFPSIDYEDLEIQGIDGAESRLVALFDGDVEYLINCQSTPKRRADIEKACDQVLETVKKK